METNKNSLQKIARIAGIGYLVIFITGIFANFFILEGLVISGDAARTFKNIVENGTQFRIGVLSFILMVIFDVVLTWALYVLFKPFNKNLALFSAWFRLVNCAIFGVALFHLFDVMNIASGADYLLAFDENQLQAQLMLSVNAFNYTWLVGLVFFGIHLFVLGYLILKSNFVANFIGILLMVAAIGYLADSFAQFMMTNYEDYKSILSMVVIIPGVVGELSLTLWLLIKKLKIV
jgi:hypothetical protein